MRVVRVFGEELFELENGVLIEWSECDGYFVNIDDNDELYEPTQYDENDKLLKVERAL